MQPLNIPMILQWLFLLAVARCRADITLRELASVYLPYDYAADGAGMYDLGAGASEQSVYDPVNAMVYTVGDNHMHVIDFSDPTRPAIVHHIPLRAAGNDVELCGDYVGVSVDGRPGTVELYRLFDAQASQLPFVASITAPPLKHVGQIRFPTAEKSKIVWRIHIDMYSNYNDRFIVGSRPDMLKFTHDCRTIVVANEGEPYESSGYIVDDEGTVSIIRLSDTGTISNPITLDFTSFNARADDYIQRGVRWPYKGQLGQGTNTFSQSLEPEYITIDKQDTKAYVCLQENNAVAIVDLTSESIVDIYPLGFKSWQDFSIDASDKNSGINFGSYDIYGMYQPDSIKYMEVDGTGYIITGNEGDDMEFAAGNNDWAESQRGEDFVDGNQLSDSVSSALRSALADDKQLGRLQFSTVDGRNSQDPSKFDRLYTYGGRSVSVFRADDFSLVFDTGDEVERKHAALYPDIFNADYDSDDPDDESPADTFDERSDNKGPETESVELGEVNGKRLLFVGNERTSTLMVYSFNRHSVIPTFESMYRSGGTRDSFSDLLEGRNTGDLDPEDLRFINGSDTPYGKPLLLVTSTMSGTVAVYEVIDSDDSDDDGGNGDFAVILQPISTVYIPYDYKSSGKAQFGLGEDAVEQSAYDPANAMVYAVGGNYLHVVDISDVTRPTIVHFQEVSSSGNDIELCGDIIGVTLDGNPGTMELYNLYDSQNNVLSRITSIQVGSKPDMLKFTHDCRTVLVVNEGETVEESDYVIDNEGSITVIRLDENGGVIERKDLNFTSFNSRAAEYVGSGVRWPYRGELSRNPTTFAQSLEPEYITYNTDETKAYICFQENNAVAVIDLTADTITEIYPLGSKSWKHLLLDASDEDGGINFAAYDIYSFYQPDAIKYMNVDGIGYIITANEGDDMDYETDRETWSEVQRGKKFIDDHQLSDLVPTKLRQALNDNGALGRLQFSAVDGRNSQDPSKFDRLYFFGGRSFSVFRADDMSLVYDSGDEVERKHAIYYPEVFNAQGKSNDPDDETPEDKFDGRSDNKGPECEALELGELNGKRLLFVAQERTSSVMVYSFPEHSAVPTFESMYRAGGTSKTFTDLLEDRNLGDLAPEDLHFVPALDSPSGKPLLLVTSTQSGTLAIYEVAEVDVSGPGSTGGSERGRSRGIVVTLATTCLIVSLIRQFI